MVVAIEIACDGVGCKEVLRSTCRNMVGAITKLKESGWRVSQIWGCIRQQHLCPTCSRRPEYVRNRERTEK